jgi:YD repeat-containing protein
MCTSSASNAALCSGYPSSITLNVLPGDYTLTVSTNLFSNTEPSTPIIRFSYLSRSTLQGGITEIFYEGFEEQADAATITPFAGLKYYNGDYTVPFITPNSKAYVVEYRYLTGGSWKHAKRPYTNNMILADGDAIDEVRVYPEDALMSTYTYQPLVGITSETDPSGKAIFYEYDPLGRLKVIKDQEGNIIKTVEYHYKTN